MDGERRHAGLGDSTGDLRAMSAGGSVIVGGSNIWDANNGVRSLAGTH